MNQGSIGAIACVLGLCLAPSAALAQDKAAAIDALMSRYHEYGLFNGTVLVAAKGQVIYKRGFGLANMEWDTPNQPDTKFRIASITKQFTAAVILQLIEEGKLRIAGHISDYLPEYPKETGARVTIHQLLVHTSGIPDYVALPNFATEVVHHTHAPSQLVDEFDHLPLEFEPGTQFRYNNSDYVVLGAIIERVTGQPYERALAERIFKPLGMTDSGYDHHETVLARRASGYQATLDGYENAAFLDMSVPYAAGSLYSTVEDLFKWDQALYTNALLSDTSKAMMLKPNVQNYGYGFVIWEERIAPVWKRVTIAAHSGHIDGFDTMIQRFLEDRSLIVLLHNTGRTDLRDIADNLKLILYGAPPRPPRKPVADLLYRLIRVEGIETAIARYRQLSAEASSDYDVRAAQVDLVGRHLLKQGQTDAALAMMKVNVELHPDTGWVYESLGDVYLATKQSQPALEAYRRALQIAPDNPALAAKVRSLTGR